MLALEHGSNLQVIQKQTHPWKAQNTKPIRALYAKKLCQLLGALLRVQGRADIALHVMFMARTV